VRSTPPKALDRSQESQKRSQAPLNTKTKVQACSKERSPNRPCRAWQPICLSATF
jgi:hypothetical protein